MKSFLLLPLVGIDAIGKVSGSAFLPTAARARLPKTSICADGLEKPASAAVETPALPNEVFPGVHLPVDRVPESIDNVSTMSKVGKYLEKAVVNGAHIGKPKDSLAYAQGVFLEVNELEHTVPSSDYKFFGNGNHKKQLRLLLKNNPFMASALTKRGDGFELKSFDPDEKNPSLFLKIMRTLNGAGHRVNVQFDHKMRIEKIKLFDDIMGTRVRGDLDEELLTSSAIYNLLFYASCVHATIHVLHYLLTAGLDFASQDFEEMNKWAKTYSNNIARKYEQVGTVLITDPPPPTQPDKTILTGPFGFGSTEAVRPILKELLDMWGGNPTAKGFLRNMMNMPEKRMKESGILKEFMKHYELTKPFAKDAAAALREIDEDKYKTAENNLKEYLQSCGDFKSNINSLEEWIEIMSITGITHGGTISYSRLLGVPDVARWRNFHGKTWDQFDILLISSGLGTVVGMEHGRHAFSPTVDKHAPKLQAVLDKYEKETLHLKETYESDIIKHKDFNDFGFLLSDYCTDNFDGKQLTLTTYI